jgi:hypothetical protein
VSGTAHFDPERSYAQVVGCRLQLDRADLVDSQTLMVGHQFSVLAFIIATSTSGVCSRGKTSSPI